MRSQTRMAPGVWVSCGRRRRGSARGGSNSLPNARRKKAQAERAQAAARERHLSALALRQGQAWQRVRAAIDTRQPGQYDATVELLGDLRAVGEREGRLAAFEHQLQDLRQQNSKKPSLLRRLDRPALGL